MQKKACLTDLSTDLTSLIFSYIIRPTDLVSLCLTCKHFHEIAVRYLYHTVTLDLGSEADKQLAAFLRPHNIGLKHIRNVELYKADVVDSCGVMRQADFAMRMLLEFLPEDQLERWSFHPWSPFSADNMVLLYKKQRKMKWLEAIQLDRAFCVCMMKELKLDSVMDNVTKLGLYPESRDTLEFAHELLRRAKSLTKITLHANFENDEIESPIPITELNDGPTGHGLLTRTIFAHKLPFAACIRIALTELTLQKVYLRYATESFCRVIDFSRLRSLRIFECSGADALFAGLCNSSRLPSCLQTLEFKHEDSRECEATHALNGFLCLVSGIENLTLDIAGTRSLPSEAGIIRHSKTIKVLNVHATIATAIEINEEDELVYDVEAFEKICKACTLLEQLSVAFPSTSITRLPSDDFTAFSSALGTLPNLITLNITSWPTNVSSSSRMPRKMYEQLLQGMAQSGFEASIANAQLNRTIPASVTNAAGADDDNSTDQQHNLAQHTDLDHPGHHEIGVHFTTSTHSRSHSRIYPPSKSKLSVIAWGTNDRMHEREDSKNTTIFVKASQRDPLGRGESVLAFQIGWTPRKYVEPRSEVLDFSLMRSVRPPTREPVGSDDGDWI